MAFRGAFYARRYRIRAKGSAVYLAQGKVRRASSEPNVALGPGTDPMATEHSFTHLLPLCRGRNIMMVFGNTALGIIPMTIGMLRLEEA